MSPVHYEGLQLEVDGHAAILTLSNPPANTWTMQSLRALAQVVAELNAAQDIYTLIVTGQGEKFFSAGADLKLFAQDDRAMARDTVRKNVRNTASEMARSFGQAFEALAAFRGFSIAALNGYAMGGGLECALACDLRIAEEHAQLALPEASVGLLPCAGGTQWLSWLVGEGWAKRMVLCGERVDAATALRIGLVQELVPRGQALALALQWASKVEKQSPLSVAACKRLMHGARQQSPAATLAAEREAFVTLFDSQDQAEGVNAFLAKRAPVWRHA